MVTIPSLDSLPFTTSTPTPADSTAWAQDLRALVAQIGPRFARSEARARVLAYLSGLLSPVKRKNGWQLAEQAGDCTPYALQHLLDRAKWDADAVRDDLQVYVRSQLADPEAILVIDETSFLKKGTHSVGVGPQYSGVTGHLENCQVGVFLVYVTIQGATFYDRALYLPKDWAAAMERRRAADVPAEVRFATKPHLARRMVERALDGGLPLRWVVGDEVYGNDGRLRQALEQRHQRYALTISATTDLWIEWEQRTARDIIAAQPADAWARLSAGDGSKGPRVYDWTRVRVNNAYSPAWERWLVARRSVVTPDDPRSTAYFLVFAPADTALEEIVRALGQRWTIETGFEESKGEVGLTQYEVRSWQGWHRHITLALLAHAFLVVLRARTHAQDTPFLSAAVPMGSLQAFRQQRGLCCP
ncbi:MAG TPA: IS701 family transposase [Candidatus Dormibacteraeota bacterium]|nr:IS701 family transposase [Candidatus Dormibacteraeota bacterium]